MLGLQGSSRFMRLSMFFSDLPPPAEASCNPTDRSKGFAQAGNRFPPRIKCGAGFFGIMLYRPL